MQEEMWTTEELARFLKVPVETIYQWNKRGEDPPPAYRLGKHLRYDRSEVMAWREKRRRAA